ncbi:hypothetical protein [Geothrix oryzisoli]|uniref:hypothetical protein n=1 Tax=Geothrix oryzisoli TaxID=2922721 RepID=UPI001FAE275E|nr:hypothetical protein [Geothrix oryzisoli]
MHTVIRGYAGHQGLADELKRRGKDIEAELSSVPGFIAYYLLKTDDGALSITICEDPRSCDESTRRAAAWLGRNLPDLKLHPPQVVEGAVSLQFTRTPALA